MSVRQNQRIQREWQVYGGPSLENIQVRLSTAVEGESQAQTKYQSRSSRSRGPEEPPKQKCVRVRRISEQDEHKARHRMRTDYYVRSYPKRVHFRGSGKVFTRSFYPDNATAIHDGGANQAKVAVFAGWEGHSILPPKKKSVWLASHHRGSTTGVKNGEETKKGDLFIHITSVLVSYY